LIIVFIYFELDRKTGRLYLFFSR